MTPVPLTVIAGYLGAGKTTLINRLLAEDHGQRLLIMVNDFGAINIDTPASARSASRPSHDHGANATYATARAAASGSADASMTSAALSGRARSRAMAGLGAPGAALTRARVASPRRRATTLSVFNDAARSGSTCSCGSGATFGGVCAILRLPVGC